jgi:Dyp-type peroxidase family
MNTPELEREEIQGNILAGFNKDYASFLFFVLPNDTTEAKAWLSDLVAEVATTQEVGAFNALFKTIRARHHQREVIEATWMNLAFTCDGLAALGVASSDLDLLPEDFREGMRARAARIGDNDDNAPGHWPAGLGTAEIHVLMTVASDSGSDRDEEVAHFVRHAARHGVTLVFQQDGMTRRDAPGHEHFGFKDGISQPGIDGFTTDPIPGQDLIAPGEFVLGYPLQNPVPVPQPGNPGYDPAVAPPDPLNPQPSWLRNGSFLVFRRLTQDVAGFQEFVRQAAQADSWSEDLLGAKLVGRYRSGAPLEGANNDQADPAVATPDVLDDSTINNFEYAPDPDGTQVPRAAHIRKAYPRDQIEPGEQEAERHRILRRGIPFGHSFHSGGRPASPYAPDAAFPQDRGLCFVCYQRSITDQFEFIQGQWVNNESFPQTTDGVDPIISQASQTRSMTIPTAPTTPLQLTKQWVTTTGGEYFFASSISAMRQFAGSD